MKTQNPFRLPTVEVATLGSNTIFEPIYVGRKHNVAYLVGDESTGDAAVFDARYDVTTVLKRVCNSGLQLKYILATHIAGNHFGSAYKLRRETGARLAAFKPVAGTDIFLNDRDILSVGRVQIEVIHTPGHTPDSVCFLLNRQKLITGSTLFVGGAPQAKSKARERTFFNSLHNVVMELDDDIEVWPGHDVGPRPQLDHWKRAAE